MLAVPVAVAATLGFGSSLSGLTEGLGSLASGPERTQGLSDAEAPGIDSSISALAAATATAGGDAGGGAPTPGAGGGGSVEGSVPAPQAGSGSGSGTSTGGGGGGGGGAALDPPDVSVPDSGAGDTVGGLLDGVGDTVDGVLGN